MENRIKVVLADANENFRTMLQQTIENTGEFDVVGSAGDGAEAWKMIERERPQLVITDVILPELDGFALLDRMAKLPARPKTILVSAFYREQMVMQAMEQGAAYFMAKPCEAGSLLERMRQAVRNGETEEESPVALERLVTSIIHEVGVSSRFRQRRKVLLPPPEGPMMDTTSFFSKSTLMCLSTSSLWKLLHRSTT